MPSNATKPAGMSARDRGLIILAIVLILIAGGFIFHTIKSGQGNETVVNVPQFGKQRKMGMGSGQDPSQTGTPGAVKGGDSAGQ